MAEFTDDELDALEKAVQAVEEEISREDVGDRELDLDVSTGEEG